MAKAEIRPLTGVRGLAASLVALYHFWPTSEIHAAILRNSVGRFYLWVDLFFVLSGFVIAFNYAHLFARGASREAFAVFMIRRFARIYPLYLVMVLVQVVLALSTQGGFHTLGDPYAAYLPDPGPDVLANLLLVQSWGVSESVVGTAWSISTEWAAYLIFPLLAALALFTRPRVAVVVATLAILLMIGAAQLDLHDGAYHSGALDAYSGRDIAPLLRCFGDFTLGLFAYRLSHSRSVMAWTASDAVGIGLLIAITIALVAGWRDLAVVALFPPLVLNLSANRGLSARLFGNRMMVRLGELSYAVYLLHPLLERPSQNLAAWLSDVMPPALAIACAAILIACLLLILSEGAYRWIERPGRQVVRRAEVAWASRGWGILTH
jgi:peptidoglycan/LPS O-acetylase OafA/YrhL